MTIGKRIRKMRRDREWSQRFLGEQISVHPNMVRLWEKDANEPSIFNCILLADLFDITLDELCGRGGNNG